jgi:hypothetical protein
METDSRITPGEGTVRFSVCTTEAERTMEVLKFARELVRLLRRAWLWAKSRIENQTIPPHHPQRSHE